VHRDPYGLELSTYSFKPDTTFRYLEKRTCLLKETAISTDKNLTDKGAEKILKYTECKNKSDTSNNGVKDNYLKIIQKISQQHTWLAQH
jgi:hypothetical protein